MICLIAVLTSLLNCAPGAVQSMNTNVSNGTTTGVLTAPCSNRCSDVAHADESPVNSDDLIAFAQSLKGIRYKYASADPDNGFDCSGFVLYVFRHFNISVPRSSSAFSKIGTKVSVDEAKPGDIILFTGTNSSVRTVGHVGIVTKSGPTLSFIHATSGKAYSVAETAMTPHYTKRFVKIVRVLD